MKKEQKGKTQKKKLKTLSKSKQSLSIYSIAITSCQVLLVAIFSNCNRPAALETLRIPQIKFPLGLI